MTKRLVIRGSVQGVGFRYSMMQEGHRLGLVGWVRNRRDGSVESVIQGNAAAVREMEEWARRGPTFSRVDGLDISDDFGDFSEFSIRDTI